MATKTGSTHISETLKVYIEIRTPNWGFRPGRARRNCPQAIRTTTTTGNGNIDVFGANLAIFGLSVVVAITLLLLLSIARHSGRSQICRWNFEFDAIIVAELLLSGCLSLLESSCRDTLFELAVVENLIGLLLEF